MPYRRLPNTDRSRLAALRTLLENGDVFMARDKFIDWKDLNEARTEHDRLLTAVNQYELDRKAQLRGSSRVKPLLRTASLYLAHFMQVLRMSVERGEIQEADLQLYSLSPGITALPPVKLVSQIQEWGPKIIEGERQRTARGGCPLANPSIDAVEAHIAALGEAYERHCRLQQRTRDIEARLKNMRPPIDALIERIWNQVESHFAPLDSEQRMEQCRKYGLRYYYRARERQATDKQQEEKETEK